MAKSKIAIVVDSTAGIPQELINKHNIFVMPLRVNWPGDPLVSYKDIVELSPANFFEKLKDSAEVPTTSQPSPGEFVEFFREIGKEYKDIVAILVSAELSGTMKSAQFALNMLEDVNVELVDSKNVGMGMGIIALEAAVQAAEGVNLKEIVRLAHEAVDKSRQWVVVDTLEYLHRGGRVSGSKKMIGTMLSMKPLLHVVEGRIELFGTVRTFRKAIKTMLDIIEVEVKTKKKLLMSISHADSPSLAQQTAATVRERFSPDALYIVEASPVISTHTGPGAVAISHLVID
jgi:DegV family protein with EDD domain